MSRQKTRRLRRENAALKRLLQEQVLEIEGRSRAPRPSDKVTISLAAMAYAIYGDKDKYQSRKRKTSSRP